MAFHLLRPDVTGRPTTLNGFLTPDECRAIIDKGENHLDLRAGKTEDHGVHENLRKSETGWFEPTDHQWLFDRISECINDVNRQWFRYDLVGFEGIQFTKYSSGKETAAGFYSAHKDTALLPGGTIRKLSFTIQLSDGEQYVGGDVILYSSFTDTLTLSRAAGSISFFPSYTIHEVTPVAKGIRYSLVGWGCGPAFV
jgi:PKHD-type hydroxylase